MCSVRATATNAQWYGYGMAELDLADGIVLVQESTSIDIQQEVDVATQSTKGLRSRQEPPAGRIRKCEAHEQHTSAAATARCRCNLVGPLGLKSVVLGWSKGTLRQFARS